MTRWCVARVNNIFLIIFKNLKLSDRPSLSKLCYASSFFLVICAISPKLLAKYIKNKNYRQQKESLKRVVVKSQM
jgi:hypothetical protein